MHLFKAALYTLLLISASDALPAPQISEISFPTSDIRVEIETIPFPTLTLGNIPSLTLSSFPSLPTISGDVVTAIATAKDGEHVTVTASSGDIPAAPNNTRKPTAVVVTAIATARDGESVTVTASAGDFPKVPIVTGRPPVIATAIATAREGESVTVIASSD
ncbi:hypothetical protein HDV05_000427 [Chytridiales sp. JEL 0842]|nr:hypothetical protein HDV05_000427 [Chytridiales sp. JEL 0842]